MDKNKTMKKSELKKIIKEVIDEGVGEFGEIIVSPYEWEEMFKQFKKLVKTGYYDNTVEEAIKWAFKRGAWEHGQRAGDKSKDWSMHSRSEKYKIDQMNKKK